MSQPPEENERTRLLRLSADHILAHGVAGLSLRGIGKAVGSNNRMLLYYFGSKEELIAAALTEAGGRFPLLERIFELLDDRDQPLRTRLEAAWELLSADENLPFHRVFFEVLGLAGYQRGRFDAFLDAVATTWRGRVATALRAEGVPADEADDLARELVALWRGLQLDLLTAGDRAATLRVNAAAAASFAASAGAAAASRSLG
ncbi:TetR/AcrR family transcriptional regulator [Streptomyces pseudovenezuelae]|uniref:AcrR family transcriptional regulator n=1 Tax=Streptomyces pseudovenezuelae TaxID=67350 RepID=A0ABT6M1F4_9ACTN|nr:TetR/AcrR family transcriptional regulator [Streptomyces pseudovenezuelae]MDH6222357.1 AcrR family transcriptional regulator [Streptomyces pseudovenezuelae]